MTKRIIIRKRIKEFDVLISNDPDEFGLKVDRDELIRKNLLRIYCRKDKYYATLLMSAEMLKEPYCDDFIHGMLTRQFDKLSVS